MNSFPIRAAAWPTPILVSAALAFALAPGAAASPALDMEGNDYANPCLNVISRSVANGDTSVLVGGTPSHVRTTDSAELPDLVIGRFDYDRSVKVTNIGGGTATASCLRVSAVLEGENGTHWVRNYSVGPLAPGASQSFALPQTAWCTVAGRHKAITASADRTTRVREYNEYNNTRTHKVWCIF